LKKRFYLFISAVLLGLCCISGAYAQLAESVDINSSANPVGSGARAQGMGGAFIAVADDATAASWNPGGLVQLERPEISFVVSYAHRRKDFSSSPHPESSGMNEVHRDDLNYFSIAVPFRAFDRNMIVSLNYQRLYDFYDDFEFDYDNRGFLSDGSFYNVQKHEKFRQSGALKALAPAFAIQLSPQFSVGLTLNFWTDNIGYDNEWENKRESRATAVIHAGPLRIPFVMSSYTNKKYENFEGFNMNMGFLWHINRMVTLGCVLKTPFTADINRKTFTYSTSVSPGSPAPPLRPLFSRESIEMKFPLSYGLGIALRLSDKFTIAGDVYRTEWSDYWIKDRNGSKSPLTGKPRQQSHIQDTTQVRIGGEYLFVFERTLVPLRMGAFYDPEPSDKNPDDYFGISVGTGMMLGNVVLDCAYIFRWARDVGGDAVGIPQSDADFDQHRLLVSMIYHF
jgi:long-subunit fatty acid transport protein